MRHLRKIKIKRLLVGCLTLLLIGQITAGLAWATVDAPDHYKDNTDYANNLQDEGAATFKFDRSDLYVELDYSNDAGTQEFTYVKGQRAYSTSYDKRIMTFKNGSEYITMDVCNLRRVWIKSTSDFYDDRADRYFFAEISDDAVVDLDFPGLISWVDDHGSTLTSWLQDTLASTETFNSTCADVAGVNKDLTPLGMRKVTINIDLNGGDSDEGGDIVQAENDFTAQDLLDNLYICLKRDGDFVLMHDHETQACAKIEGVDTEDILEDNDNTQKEFTIYTGGARSGDYEVAVLGLGATRTEAEDVQFEQTGSNHKDYRAVRDGDLDIDFPHILSEVQEDPDQYMQKVADLEAAYADLGVEGFSTDTDDDGDSELDDVIGCESGSGPLGWIVCPIINAMVDTVDWVRITVIEPFLKVSPLQTGDSNDATYAVWVQIRNLAYALLIPLFLVMIMSQALSFEVFDAYTVKRALPRIIVATIGIALSYYACAFLIDFFNVLGGGIDNLVTRALEDSGTDINISADSVAASGFVNVAGILGVGGTIWLLTSAAGATIGLFLLMVVLPLVLGVISVFITLIARQAIIMVLVILSPLAFLAYIFPSTESYFKTWFSIFTKVLFMYPLIILLLMAGGLFAAILTSGDQSPLAQIAAIVAVTVPMFLIPATFKMAGSAIGALGGALTNLSGKIRAPLTDRRNPNSAYNMLKNRQRVGQQRTGVRFIRNNVNRKGGISPRRGLAKAYARFGPNLDVAEAGFNEEASKQVEALVNNGKDGYVYAMLGIDKDPRTGKPLEKDAILYAKRNKGNTHLTQASLSYALRKAAETDQLTNVKDNLIARGRGRGLQDHEIDGAWIGAAFANQMQHGELKHQTANPDAAMRSLLAAKSGDPGFDASSTGVGAYTPGKARDLVQEGLETKGSYAFAQQRESYWKGLQNAEKRVTMHRDLLRSGDREYIAKLNADAAAAGNGPIDVDAEARAADATLSKYTELKQGLAQEITASGRSGISGTTDEEGDMFTRTGAPILASKAMRAFLGDAYTPPPPRDGGGGAGGGGGGLILPGDPGFRG